MAVADTPSAPAVDLDETLLDALFARSRPEIAEALHLAAIPEWFDAALLAALRGPADADGLTPRIFERIGRLSFVSALDGAPEAPRLRFSPEMRAALLKRAAADPDTWRAAHGRAQAYFEDLAAQADPFVAEELRANALYHRLVAEPVPGLHELVERVDAALSAYQLPLAERLIAIGREQQAALPPGDTHWIDYLAACLALRQRRFTEARQALTTLLAKPDLPATLRPHVQAALAETLVQAEQWSGAVALYRTALDAFHAADDRHNAAHAMLGLGRAYLDLAFNIWGQRRPEPAPAWTLRTAPLEILRLIGRLPILVYLVWHLGTRLLTAIHTVAYGQDWLIARLLVTAAGWLRRAENDFDALGDAADAALAHEERAQLYLALGHPGRAVRHYTNLLTRPAVARNEYRTALVWLGLAEARWMQRRPASACAAVAQAIPVLVTYRDDYHLLDARLVYGRACAALGRTAEAEEALGHALAAAQAVGDEVAATQIEQVLDGLATPAPTLAPLARHSQTTLAGEGMSPPPQVPERRASGARVGVYLVPYAHPWLAAFRRLGLWALAVTLFLVPLLAIRPSNSASVGGSSELRVAPFISPSANPADNFTPSLSAELVQVLHSEFHTEIARDAALLLAGGYLLLYTLLGVIIIARTPLQQLQRGQRDDLRLDAGGITRGTEPPVPWSAVTARVAAEVRLGRGLLPDYSSRTVLAGARAIPIHAGIPAYASACADIEAHLPAGARREDYGFSLLYSKMGLLFLLTTACLLTFALVAQAAPGAAAADAFGPYSAADLYGLLPLGLAVPLIYWLAARPLAAQTRADPAARLPWFIGLAGLAPVALGCAGLLRGPVSLGITDVVVALSGLALVALAIAALWRARGPNGAPVYSPGVRYGLLAALAVLAAVTGALAGRRLTAYNYQLLGDNWREAGRAALVADDAARAQPLFAQARALYDTSLAYYPGDPPALTARGTVASLAGEWQAAIDDYSSVIAGSGGTALLYANRAVAEQGLAQDIRARGTLTGSLPYYQRAHDDFTQALALDPGNYAYALQGANLHLASGELEQAEAEYRATIALAPQRCEAHTGLGWALYQRALRTGTGDEQTALWHAALDAFNAAVARGAQDQATFTGRAYAYYQLDELDAAVVNFKAAVLAARDDAGAHIAEGTLYWIQSTALLINGSSPCTKNSAAAETKAAYGAFILDAIAAYDAGIALRPNQPIVLFRRAQLHWLVAACPGESFVAHYEQAIADTTAAIALDGTHVDWYIRRGNFHYGLRSKPGRDYVAETRAAIADYGEALARQPAAAWYQARAAMRYDIVGLSGVDDIAELHAAIADYDSALALEPDRPDWLRLRGNCHGSLARREGQDQIAERKAAIADYLAAWQLEGTPSAATLAGLAVHESRLARLQYDAGDYAGSVVSARSALEHDGTRLDARLTLGLALLAADANDEAVAVYGEALAQIGKTADPAARAALYTSTLSDVLALRGKRLAEHKDVDTIDAVVAMIVKVR